jgi:hypothetical protein
MLYIYGKGKEIKNDRRKIGRKKYANCGPKRNTGGYKKTCSTRAR